MLRSESVSRSFVMRRWVSLSSFLVHGSFDEFFFFPPYRRYLGSDGASEHDARWLWPRCEKLFFFFCQYSESGNWGVIANRRVWLRLNISYRRRRLFVETVSQNGCKLSVLCMILGNFLRPFSLSGWFKKKFIIAKLIHPSLSHRGQWAIVGVSKCPFFF